MSSPTSRAVIGGRSAWRGEETRPFPSMAPSPPSSGLQQLDNYNSGGEEEGIVEVGASDDGERSPGTDIHPGEGGIFNFHSGEGSQSPVKLTHLAPISPTNEDVHSSAELRSNPQPPISSSFLQVLSPARAGGPMGTYAPFLFPGHHPSVFQMHDNEKYRKAMMKKQRRESKKDKNVRNVYQAKDVEGHKDEDIDSILQSLGEKGDDKKIKAKKTKEKIEKGKVEKRERSRRSEEKELEDQTENDVNTDIAKEDKIKRVTTPDLITTELIDFKNNFYLVTPEPGPLSKTKSRETLVASTESLTQFTKVTKKHRGKRSKDEVGPGKSQPPAAPQELSRRTSGYALRSRDVQPTQAVIRLDSSSSEPAIQSSISTPPVTVPSFNLENNFPKLAKDDFPALPGGKDVSTPVFPSAWGKVVTNTRKDTKEVIPLTSDSEEVISIDNNTVQELREVIESSEGNKDKDLVKDASDSKAVINCDVPIDSDINNCNELQEQEDNNVIDNELSIDEMVSAESENDINAEENAGSFPEGLNENGITCLNNGDININLSDGEKTETEEFIETVDKDIEVVVSEDEFNKKKANNSAPVVILGESDQDWKSSEFSFGFDVNHDLVASSGQGSEMDRTEMVQQEIIHQHQIPGSYYASMGPGAPLTPIDTVDGAILSFGGPESAGLRPLIVGVPVGVPVPVSVGAGGTIHPAALHYFPPPFPHFSLPFPVAGPVPTAAHYQDQEEPELSGQDIVQEDEHEKTGSDHQEHQTISPESGISSASPLSWQPDSSPSLAAPGSYPHPHHTSPPLVNHVNQSLSGWQGHSASSSPGNSSRNSPTPPGWATQVENFSFNDKQEKNNNYSHSLEDRKGIEYNEHHDEEEHDSGLSMEIGGLNHSQELREKFNLGEIVTFISSSWSNVSKDSSLQVYSNNSTTASSS